ncbi:MAG TPA: hypothetical protein PK213_14310 [Deltaproteobacteria bacterium]|nr:hypothetical protein [Deltaproteobacteria bacterium]
MAKIAIEHAGDVNRLEMAKAGLVLDAVKENGARLVELLENLGQNVDLYA